MAYIIITILLLFIIYKILKKEKKQPKIVNIVEIPAHWYPLLEENVLFYKKLNTKDRLHFKKRIQSFLNSVEIVAVDFELEDLDILLVASSAVIPVFGFNNWMYPNLKEVIIYPDYFNDNLEFASKSKNKIIGGLVGNGMFENKMILSRRALHHGFANKTDKGNTGIHEFVHLLDKLDGTIDGIPKALLDNENLVQWLDVVHDKMEAINKDKSDIRNYGGTSKEEFFAVASEYFFERPMLLKRKHPELYKMLDDCFNID
ncbi:zinc-dependent peptidase [Tenacibaculum tangerinum]|uniref:Zinc-dependent peptidase n=1 Tax=Tenacibaculum tangerinum TaxID=3038772 RepID=A0ABY8L3Z8_9FLAO|nr:zinc-dependent peptidase [Tenacibaculum tangerinum]WGH76105.1 zinc-dependent peptidase [Tenacibaculum tangerinum]